MQPQSSPKGTTGNIVHGMNFSSPLIPRGATGSMTPSGNSLDTTTHSVPLSQATAAGSLTPRTKSEAFPAASLTPASQRTAHVPAFQAPGSSSVSPTTYDANYSAAQIAQPAPYVPSQQTIGAWQQSEHTAYPSQQAGYAAHTGYAPFSPDGRTDLSLPSQASPRHPRQPMTNPFAISQALQEPAHGREQPMGVHWQQEGTFQPPIYPGELLPPPTAEQLQRERETQHSGGFNNLLQEPLVGADAYLQPLARCGRRSSYAATKRKSMLSQIGRCLTDNVSDLAINKRTTHSSVYTDFQSKYNHWEDFVRPTFFRMPSSVSLAQRLDFPMGFIVQPLAPVLEGQIEVPLIYSADVGIVRCNRCRAYVNPYAKFIDDGTRWTCNLCGFSSETPSHYYCDLDTSGKRRDCESRPELCTTSVEFIAPSDYSARPAQNPAYLFIIDVSANAVKSGFLQTVAESITRTLRSESLPNQKGTFEVGVITYDTVLHFYDLGKEQTPMIVMAEVDDVFIPICDVLVNFAENDLAISSFFKNLPKVWAETTVRETCLGSALHVAHEVFKQKGGKVCIFASQMSTIGPTELRQSPHRHCPSFLNTDRESELLRPANDAYEKLGEKLVMESVSVDLFVGTSSSFDLATVLPIVTITGGDVHFYPNFSPQNDYKKVYGDVWHTMQRQNAWEAALRVRVSRGWKVERYYGHCHTKSPGLIVIPNCHEFQTFGVTVALEDDAAPEPIMYMQVAMLYTDQHGIRRVRVHTWNCPVTSSVHEMIESIDSEALTVMTLHFAAEKAITGKIHDARQYVDTMARKVILIQQNILRYALQLLPVDLLGVLKSVAFKAIVVPADLRMYHIARLRSASIPLVAVYFYPRLVCLTDMPEDVMELDEYDRPSLPPMLNLGVESMTRDGMYLIENGEDVILWVGDEMDPDMMYSLFGVSTIDELDPTSFHAYWNYWNGRDDVDELLEKIMDLIGVMREERLPMTMDLQCAKPGDQLEHAFFQLLIEDATDALQVTYQQFVKMLGGQFHPSPRRISQRIARQTTTASLRS
eukprot:GEMP01002213.1.p1 GENE.GEMP01002213.1~~GEMP01002213.1.p1  ORF type:complete len:1042 (+),score=152.49 GEMP01002213.1:405-3530(+)